MKTTIFMLLLLLTKTAFSQDVFNLVPAWGNLPLNEISIPGTHNSFSNHHDIHYQIPGTLNSNINLSEQLLKGVRAIELDVHEPLIGKHLVVGHSPTKRMINESKPVAYFFDIISNFLLTNTDQFLVLKLQNFVSSGRIETELRENYPEMLKLIFMHTLGAPIPTLNQLLKRNQRLVIILGSKQYGANLTQIATTGDLYNRKDIYLEKNYSKGPSDADLFDTTSYNISELGGSSASDASYNNAPDRLEEFCVKAWAATGKKLFRITVDYAGEGDVFKVANNLNNDYYSVKGEVRDKANKLLKSVTWNIQTATSKKNLMLKNKITYGRFNFPLNKHYGLLKLTPISDTFSFSPVTVNMENYSKIVSLKFTATLKQ